MAKKYVYISLIPVVIWFLTVLYFYEESKILLLFLGPAILFVMLCYIIGLLKDIRAKLGTHEIGSEEKFFVKGEKDTEKAESADDTAPETKAPEEDAGK